MEKVSSNTSESLGLKSQFGDSQLVEVERVFHTPVERVWEAWTSPELIKQWWGPEGYSCPECKVDLRVGGRILAAMTGPDQKTVWSGGEYKEIVTNERIVCTDEFTDERGNVVPASHYGMTGNWPETCLVTVTFESTGDNETRFRIEHEGIPKEMHDDCVQGWESSLNKLQKLVERN